MSVLKPLKIFLFLTLCFGIFGVFLTALLQDLSSVSLSDYEIITPKNIGQLRQLVKWNAADAVFSPSGTMLAVASDNLIKLINLSNLNAPTIKLQTDLTNGRLNFSMDGARLIYQNNDGEFDLWNVASATKITLPNLKTIKAFSPSLKLFATIEDNTIVLYKLDSSKEQIAIPVNDELVKLRFNLNDSQLAILYPHTVKVWDLRNNIENFSYAVVSDEMSDVVFSPDGKQLVVMWYGLTADYSKYTTKIQIWYSETLQTVGLLVGDGMQYSLKFSPVGSTISAAGEGNNLTDMVRLWDKVSQREITTFTALSGGAIIAFSSNEDLLAIGSGTTPNVKITNLYTDDSNSSVTLNTGNGTIKEQFNSGDQLLLVVAVQEPNIDRVSLWGIRQN